LTILNSSFHSPHQHPCAELVLALMKVKVTDNTSTPLISKQMYSVFFQIKVCSIEAYFILHHKKCRYKPEGRGFDCRMSHWNFSLKQSFRPHYGPGVHSASNRNEYQEYFLGLNVTGAYG
jgi:hypothetical protein